MDRYFLQSPRLGFRQWSSEDLPLAIALWSDPEVTRFIGGPFSIDKIQARLESEITQFSKHKIQYWPIFLLGSDEHAGCAGLRPTPQDRIFELGVHLLRPCWGQGLAEEASRTIIQFAFDNLGAKGLFAGHHPANSASRHLVQKLGFRFTHEEFYPPTGLNHPSYLLEPPTHS